MDGGSIMMLRNLCRIFNIPVDSTRPSPFVALQLLLHLYGMPLIKDQPKRRNYGVAILQSTAGAFDPNSQFVARLGNVVGMMQELPQFYNKINLSTEELVSIYQSIAWRNRWLERLGVIGGAGAFTAGAGEALKKRSIKAGVVKIGSRLAGHGPITEGIAAGFGTSLPKGSGWMAAALIVGANGTYYAGKDSMREIKALLTHRMSNGQMTAQQYREVFGNETNPASIKKYWEYR